jgi:prevent-host-death family protein
MKRAPVTMIRKQFAKFIHNAENGERSVIVRNGHSAAAIISFADYEFLQRAQKSAIRSRKKS